MRGVGCTGDGGAEKLGVSLVIIKAGRHCQCETRGTNGGGSGTRTTGGGLPRELELQRSVLAGAGGAVEMQR